MWRKQLTLLLFLVFMMTDPIPFQAQAMPNPTSFYGDVKRIVLDNGLVILLKPARKANTVSIYLAVKSGSADESRWQGSGLSHFVEHMFFKGTQTRDKGTIEKQVREMGGYINAYTSHDTTVFYLSVLSNHLEGAIDLMYDAAFHPTFDAGELDKEREVILSEMRMNEDRLSRKALVTLWELTFRKHPYRHPVIGYPALFKKVTREDLAAFFKQYYTPNNMVFSVVGDMDPAAAEQLIRERFGKEARGVGPDASHGKEPHQSSPRRSVIYKPAQHARLMIGFPSVPLTHPDSGTLDLLAQILGEDASSRLHQIIKEEEQRVLEIGAFNSTLVEGGLIAVDALLVPDQVALARESILREFQRIQKKGVTAEELGRAKQQTLGDYYHHWETHSAMAHDLVANEVYTGDYRYSEHYVEQIKAVTVEDVQRVAKQYLDTNRLNEVLLLPEHAKTDAPPDQLPVEPLFEKIERVVLPNGMRVLLLEDHSTPMTYAQVAFLGGVLLENEQNNGINALLSELLIRGTRTKNQKQIAQAVSGWGGDLGSYSGQNSYGISLSFLSEFHEPALALLEDILQKPAFHAEEFLKVKKDQLEALLAEKEDIFTHANRELLKGIYQSHPYRLNPLGTEASLGKVTRQDAIDFYETTLDPKRMVVAVFGDIDAKKMRDRLKKSLGVMAAPMASKKEEPAEERIDAVRDIHSTVPRAQAVGMLAFNGVPVTDERPPGRVKSATSGPTSFPPCARPPATTSPSCCRASTPRSWTCFSHTSPTPWSPMRTPS